MNINTFVQSALTKLKTIKQRAEARLKSILPTQSALPVTKFVPIGRVLGTKRYRGSRALINDAAKFPARPRQSSADAT